MGFPERLDIVLSWPDSVPFLDTVLSLPDSVKGTESGQLNTMSRRSGKPIYAPLRLSDWVSPGLVFKTIPVSAWLTLALSWPLKEDRRGLVRRFNPVQLALERLAELGSRCLTKPRFTAPETLQTLPRLVLLLKGHPLSSTDTVCAHGNT